MSFSLKSAIFFISLLLSSIGYAESFSVVNVKSVGTPQLQADAVKALLESHLADLGHTVSSSENPEFKIELTLISVGKSTRISARKTNQDGKTFSTTQIAASEEEADRVVKRIASDIHLERKQPSVDNVTQEEALRQNSKESTTRYFQLAFGPSFSHGIRAKNSFLNFRLGYAWEVSGFRPGMFVHFGGTTKEGQSGAYNYGVSFDSILTSARFAPYLGGEFSYGQYTADNRDLGNGETEDVKNSGFMLTGKAGYLLLRTSSVAINANVYYRAGLFSVEKKAPGDAGLMVGLDF
jgi:hypothetical protein